MPADATRQPAWMRRALDARRAGPSHGVAEPAGRLRPRARRAVVGEGWHERAGGPHAEVVALAAAGERAAGATAYVTLEPCTHTGRTGPCTRRSSPPGCPGSSSPPPIPTPSRRGERRCCGPADARDVGVSPRRPAAERRLPPRLERAALRHREGGGEPRWADRRGGRDLAVAHRTAARERAHALRAEVDAVVVGSGTVLADDPALTCRWPGTGAPAAPGRPRRPRTDPLDARVLDDAASTLLVVRERPPDAGAGRTSGRGPDTRGRRRHRGRPRAAVLALLATATSAASSSRAARGPPRLPHGRASSTASSCMSRPCCSATRASAARRAVGLQPRGRAAPRLARRRAGRRPTRCSSPCSPRIRRRSEPCSPASSRSSAPWRPRGHRRRASPSCDIACTGVVRDARVGDSISVNGCCLTVTSFLHDGSDGAAGLLAPR
jgi:hypothetical protein